MTSQVLFVATRGSSVVVEEARPALVHGKTRSGEVKLNSCIYVSDLIEAGDK